MQLTGLFFAGVDRVLHILFFLLESILWGKPAVNKIFQQTADTVEVTRLLAFNQGFYNLFLSVGTFVGIYLLVTGSKVAGLTTITFGCGCMFAASLILLYSSPKAIGGVILQGAPPLIALVLLWMSR